MDAVRFDSDGTHLDMTVHAPPATGAPIIASVGAALADHYYDQEALLRALRDLWGERLSSAPRLAQLHRNMLVGGRHLALPIESYAGLGGFTAANDVFVRVGTELGERAIREALKRAGLAPRDVDHLFSVSVTGIATPSIDARLVNRLGLRSDVKRTPIFGLGCVGGAAGLARAADYLRGHPDEIVVLLSVELCSLTLQREDLSVANLIASGLFGDGAVAVVIAGARRAAGGPAVVATRSVFYPDTEDVMGWRITGDGFRVVLSGRVPGMAGAVRDDVDRFLLHHRLTRADLSSHVCHPGGPRVLEALAEALEVDREALAVAWDSLERVGNLSSASVLLVLGETMASHRPPSPSHGLLLAMGPGFCAELVLLAW